MRYQGDQLKKLLFGFVTARSELIDAAADCLGDLDSFTPTDRLREYVTYGVARRLGAATKCITRVFDLLPPDSDARIESEVSEDATLFLQAFIMNVGGLADCWAWCYLIRHGRDQGLKENQVGLFHPKTQKLLPQPLVDYSRSTRLVSWREQYHKVFRDGLAHRIPPYVPPMHLSPEEAAERRALVAGGNLNEILEGTTRMGTAPKFFAMDGGTQPVWIHTQMIGDARLAAEMTTMFLKHWSTPPT